jgi:regulation of enolase protein 1 (concanavalin A-like superfamily)
VTDANILEIPGLPALSWLTEPGPAEVTAGPSLSITAGPRTDWVADPVTRTRIRSAPAIAFPAPDACILSARVTASFAGTFDAGVLVAYQDEDTWAKLCFEFSPQRQPMVVSVVTRGLSDDCNSVTVDRDWVYLRIARTPAALAFHYSLDGGYWHFVRLFALGEPGAPTSLGFLAQSPFGESATARFSDIRCETGTLADYRSGE